MTRLKWSIICVDCGLHNGNLIHSIVVFVVLVGSQPWQIDPRHNGHWFRLPAPPCRVWSAVSPLLPHWTRCWIGYNNNNQPKKSTPIWHHTFLLIPFIPFGCHGDDERPTMAGRHLRAIVDLLGLEDWSRARDIARLSLRSISARGLGLYAGHRCRRGVQFESLIVTQGFWLGALGRLGDPFGRTSSSEFHQYTFFFLAVSSQQLQLPAVRISINGARYSTVAFIKRSMFR